MRAANVGGVQKLRAELTLMTTAREHYKGESKRKKARQQTNAEIMRIAQRERQPLWAPRDNKTEFLRGASPLPPSLPHHILKSDFNLTDQALPEACSAPQ